jgi:hypothetical protein
MVISWRQVVASSAQFFSLQPISSGRELLRRQEREADWGGAAREA